MNVQAFYKALAKVMADRTDTEIKVKEITGYEKNSRN